MASKLDICNQALLKLGQPAIMSVTDDSIRARQCFQEFDSAFEATLRIYPWPFAVKRIELSLLLDKPAFGFANFFQLPTDSVRIIEVYTNELPYNIETGKLATDSSVASVKYITKNIQPEALDELTSNVIATKLAAALCILITENMQLKVMLEQEAEILLAQARNTSAVEDYPREVIEGDWLATRESSYTWEVGNPWGTNGTGEDPWNPHNKQLADAMNLIQTLTLKVEEQAAQIKSLQQAKS